MLLRRSLFSSLWGENDGVLNQINGVTREFTQKLRDNGISTFADAVNSSNENIARFCGVTTSFAASLRSAAAKILKRTLKVSARTEAKNDGNLELHIKLERRVPNARSVEETNNDKVVSYSLLVFTDRAGSLFHYSEDITSACEMRVQCPEKFGRA